MNVEDIERFIDRWRATLTPDRTPEDVDGFMRRHRGEVQLLVLRTLARRGAERGDRPEILADFLAYDVVAAAQRSLDDKPDPQVLGELMRQMDARLTRGYDELFVLHSFAADYVDTRTEAIFLRDAGWDVVPLLVEQPALAIVADGHVVATRDSMGWLNIHPERRGTLNRLFADLQRVEDRVSQLGEVIDLERNTRERLMKYAVAAWKHARKEVERNNPQSRPNPTRSDPRR